MLNNIKNRVNPMLLSKKCLSLQRFQKVKQLILSVRDGYSALKVMFRGETTVKDRLG